MHLNLVWKRLKSIFEKYKLSTAAWLFVLSIRTLTPFSVVLLSVYILSQNTSFLSNWIGEIINLIHYLLIQFSITVFFSKQYYNFMLKKRRKMHWNKFRLRPFQRRWCFLFKISYKYLKIVKMIKYLSRNIFLRVFLTCFFFFFFKSISNIVA